MVKIIQIMKWMISLHYFFVTESRSYLGTMSRNDIAYYPFAYVKFMWASFVDCLNSMKIITTLKIKGMES